MQNRQQVSVLSPVIKKEEKRNKQEKQKEHRKTILEKEELTQSNFLEI